MSKYAHRIYIFILVAITLTVFFLTAIYGAGYYTTPVAERHFHEQYEI